MSRNLVIHGDDVLNGWEAGSAVEQCPMHFHNAGLVIRVEPLQSFVGLFQGIVRNRWIKVVRGVQVLAMYKNRPSG